MEKKLFFLLISCLLMASNGLYAQSSNIFVDEDEVVVTVPVTDDTVVVHRPEHTQIQVLERTWGVNLESYLRDKIVYLSTHPSDKKVSKSDIRYVYKVYQVPCRDGKQIVYLSMTAEPIEFYLSKQDPSTMEEICSCYLDLALPQRVTEPTPSRHQTDDTEYFGVAKPNGQDGNIKDLW